MLVLAREAKGLTQADVANACGISQALVSKAESGLANLSEDAIESLAKLLEVRTEFFLEPASVVGLGSACLQFRKRQALPAKKLREIVARVNVTRVQIERMLRSVEITEQRFPTFDVDEFGGAERIAGLVRAAWGLPPRSEEHTSE